MIRIKRLRGGTTHTVETYWNVSATAFFRGPAGAKINVKYGKGWASVNRQSQTLNGRDVKKLKVGAGSLVVARMRVKLPADGEIAYDVSPGDVARPSPEFNF